MDCGFVTGVGAHARALRERPACRPVTIYAHVVVRRPSAGAAPVLAGGRVVQTTLQASGVAA
ncbi:hypothetical protein BURMUCGD1_6647 [Burkholderia multivorans CGD1]|nr:hypothetical protein BURMUCGD1_6647 [Burkholderia multivorans CGD1]